VIPKIKYHKLIKETNRGTHLAFVIVSTHNLGCPVAVAYRASSDLLVHPHKYRNAIEIVSVVAIYNLARHRNRV